MTKLKPPFQIMLLAGIVFMVFYPTLFAEICLVDDYGAIMAVFNNENISLQNIFFPRSLYGGYYRPLIDLSYWFDKQAWFLDEHLMHFEGVVAHLVNAFLVYFICRKAIYLYQGRRDTWHSFAAALLFSLHPIVTESVNWISGRTDIMMGTFVLASVLLLLHYNAAGKRWLLIPAMLCAFIAVLAKETAFGYLAGMPLLIKSCSSSNQIAFPSSQDNYQFKLLRFLAYYGIAVLIALYIGSFWLVLAVFGCYLVHLLFAKYSQIGIPSKALLSRRLLILCISVGLSSLLFITLRKLAFASNVAKIWQTVMLMFADTNYTISLFVGATGFYVKKFFLPLPLNFFILEIDPLYDFLGIAIVLLCMHLLMVRTLPAIMFIIGFLLMLPALPFTFGTIAWTAYAERYIYLSTAFWVLALVLTASRLDWHGKRTNMVIAGATAFICLVAAVITYNRNYVWKTNVALMRDTVAQSPKKRNLRDMYINALVNAGRLNEAEKEYHYVTVHLPTAANDDKADLMVGGALVKQGHTTDALRLYQAALVRTKFTSEPLLVSTIRLLHTMKESEMIATAERSRLGALEQAYTVKLYTITKNPLLLMEGGAAAMRSGSYSEAYTSTEAALRFMLPGDHLRRTAQQRLRELRKHLDPQHTF